MNGDRQTNRGLVFFSIILIGLGVVYGFYPLSIIGILFLIPAFLIPSKPPPPRPKPKPEETRRVTPPAPPSRVGSVPAQTQSYPSPTGMMRSPEQAKQAQPIQPMQPVSSAIENRLEVIPALFPTTMFPSASPYMLTPTPLAEKREEKQESRDELVEFALLLAVLKLFSG